MYPYPPCSCRHLSTTLFCSSVVWNLDAAACSAVSLPSQWSSMHLSTYAWATCTSVCSSASTNFEFWNDEIDCPNAFRLFVYSMVIRSAEAATATAPTAMESRSCARLRMRYVNPIPGSPSTFAAGTSTSLKNSSAVSWACMPSLSRLRPRSNPFIPRSRIMRVKPRWPASGSVRTVVITRSELMPLVMKVFAPFSTHVSPWRTAVLRTPATSLPVFGSVMARAPISSPRTMPGNQRCFCSSLARDR